MKKLRIKKSYIIALFVLAIVAISSYGIALHFKSEPVDIDKVLKSESYSYLPKEAKNYVKKVFEQSGEVILTEKNKQE